MSTQALGVIPQFGISDRLRKSREHAQLEQGDLADRISVSRNTISNYETGRVEPRSAVVRSWALATGVDVGWLMTGRGPSGGHDDGGAAVTTAGTAVPPLGERLIVAAFNHPRGMNGAVEAIRLHLGPQAGSRNTYARLLRIPSASELSDKDRFRAWCLATALGLDPEALGLPDDVVPSGYDTPRLRELLPGRPRQDSNLQPAD